MVINYKCPSCGAPMLFNPETQKLSCDYCGTTLSVEEYKKQFGDPEKREETAEEKAAEKAQKVETEEEGAKAEGETGPSMKVKRYICPSCGAEVVTDELTAATMCSFCGNTTLMEDVLEEKCPVEVIPFKITKEQALEKFKAWTKKGLFTPKDFKSANTMEKMTGIYVPFWLVDYKANVKLHAHCTRTRTTRTRDMEYIYTDHFDVRRDVDAGYTKIPMDASEKMEDKTMDLLEPFHYEDLKKFEMPYPSGYLAEVYSQTDKDMEERGKGRVRKYAVDEAMATITGYSGVNIVQQNLRIDEEKAEYVMLPVWMLNYRYKDKTYQFALNGQTGKQVGTLPLSKGRMAGFFGGLTAGIWIMLTLIHIIGGVV